MNKIYKVVQRNVRNEEWTVCVAIDYSTSFKVGEHIEIEETNLGYIWLLRKYLKSLRNQFK